MKRSGKNSMFLVKSAFFAGTTALALVLALIPEAAMWLLWRIAAPSTEMARTILVIAFALIGGGACIFFAFLGFLLWGCCMKALLDS